jgi:hypothetical protein
MVQVQPLNSLEQFLFLQKRWDKILILNFAATCSWTFNISGRISIILFFPAEVPPNTVISGCTINATKIDQIQTEDKRQKTKAIRPHSTNSSNFNIQVLVPIDFNYTAIK